MQRRLSRSRDTALLINQTKKIMEQKYLYQLQYKKKNLFVEAGYSAYHVIDKTFNLLVSQGHQIKRKDLTAIKL